MAVFAPCVLVVTTYRSSWGQLLWFENLLVIHLIVLTVAVVIGPIGENRPPPWAMQWCAVATVVLYMLAGVAKLRYGGSAWISGDVLAHHIGYSSARLSVFGERPPLLASFAVNHTGALAVASFTTVALELVAPLALLRRWLAVVWSTAMWAMHVGIALTMAVAFPYPIVGLAFVPVVAAAPSVVPGMPSPATVVTRPPSRRRIRWLPASATKTAVPDRASPPVAPLNFADSAGPSANPTGDDPARVATAPPEAAAGSAVGTAARMTAAATTGTSRLVVDPESQCDDRMGVLSSDGIALAVCGGDPPRNSSAGSRQPLKNRP